MNKFEFERGMVCRDILEHTVTSFGFTKLRFQYLIVSRENKKEKRKKGTLLLYHKSMCNCLVLELQLRNY